MHKHGHAISCMSTAIIAMHRYVKISPMDSLCGCTCSAKLHVFMLLGVVCGQSHFVPLRLWSIDVYHLVLFLSADSSTGFGSQLEEIVTQGAMLVSQYETPFVFYMKA